MLISPIRTTPHSPGRLTRTCKHVLHAMCLALCEVCYMNHIQQIPKLYYYPIDGRKGPEKVSLCDLGANCLSGKLKCEMLTPSGSLFEVCTKQPQDCPTVQLLCELTGCCWPCSPAPAYTLLSVLASHGCQLPFTVLSTQPGTLDRHGRRSLSYQLSSDLQGETFQIHSRSNFSRTWRRTFLPGDFSDIRMDKQGFHIIPLPGEI